MLAQKVNAKFGTYEQMISLAGHSQSRWMLAELRADPSKLLRVRAQLRSHDSSLCTASRGRQSPVFLVISVSVDMRKVHSAGQLLDVTLALCLQVPLGISRDCEHR